MDLGQFKEYISKFPEGKIFTYGISKPFSWRGSYDEVAFAILESEMSRDDILSQINRALNGVFEGYKGGAFSYYESTKVNFEETIRNYTDGGYAGEWIAKIESTTAYKSQEERLVNLAFN
jgi:hypothetical protein